MPLPIEEITVVSDPLLAKRLFLDDAESFTRSRWTRRMISPIVGEGLLLAEGEAWRRQRRMLQPAFHHERVASYVDAMASCARDMVDEWSPGLERDVYGDARAFSVHVAARTMFGAELGAEAARVRAALNEAVAAFDRFKSSRLPLPLAVPTPNGLRLRRATRELERLIFRAVHQRRAGGEQKLDLLSLLLDARDTDGQPLTDQEIRDEAMTMFAGGTETTAMTLAWACHLLALHSNEMERVRAEVARVVGDGPVRPEHVYGLTYVEKVIKETLRLFPPVWRTSREAVRTCSLDSYTVRKGKLVVACQYLIQRNPNYFADPERFEPSRWSDEFSKSLPKFAYFPFGGGQRMCIGQSFAMTELIVALAVIVLHARFEPAAQQPRPYGGTMLRPKHGVRLRILKGGAAKGEGAAERVNLRGSS
jgi:cytochrome P450